MSQRSIRIPDDLEARVEKVAEEQDRTFSYLVVKALELAYPEPRRNEHPTQKPGPPSVADTWRR